MKKTKQKIHKLKKTNKTNKTRKAAKRGGNETEHAAAKKIQDFMKAPKVQERRCSQFLKSICSDSNVCIAFGVEEQKIRKFFDGYINTKYIKLPIRRIGATSINGVVNELTYERDGYISYAILKSSVKRKSDNLFYEYIVGKYLNKMSNFYPCIIQTYGLFEYQNNETYNRLLNSSVDSFSSLNLVGIDLVSQPSEDIFKQLLYEACTYPLSHAVLTQHIRAVPMANLMTARNVLYNYFSLHQIYFTLHCLRNTFTHYDLHVGNVLCYEPSPNKYIEFIYHMNDGTIVQYNFHRLSYMIDYGRSYFFENNTMNSEIIYNNLCVKDKCPSPCGSNDGFGRLYRSYENVSTRIRNMSADLRLIKIMSLFRDNAYGTLIPFKESILFKGPYSTPEVETSGLNSSKGPDTINNVSDAMRVLVKYTAKYNSVLNDKYKRFGYTKMGTLRIYENGITPIQYTAASPDSTICIQTRPDTNTIRQTVATATNVPQPIPPPISSIPQQPPSTVAPTNTNVAVENIPKIARTDIKSILKKPVQDGTITIPPPQPPQIHINETKEPATVHRPPALILPANFYDEKTKSLDDAN
jgi:hypothetical protein